MIGPLKSLSLIAAIVLLLLSGPLSPAAARVYIDIDTPTFQKFPIAVTDFNKLSTERGGSDLPIWFSDTLSNYFEFSSVVCNFGNFFFDSF